MKQNSVLCSMQHTLTYTDWSQKKWKSYLKCTHKLISHIVNIDKSEYELLAQWLCSSHDQPNGCLNRQSKTSTVTQTQPIEGEWERVAATLHFDMMTWDRQQKITKSKQLNRIGYWRCFIYVCGICLFTEDVGAREKRWSV